MGIPVMKSIIEKAMDNPLPLAGAAILVIGFVYLLVRKTAADVAKAAGGVISGDNVVTNNQTNFAGEKTDAYVGKGVAGTVGAAVNSASGGLFASIGESIGGGLFVIFGAKDTTPKTYYSVKFPDGKTHAVGDTWVDSKGMFSYEGRRYKLGTLSGVRVATAA